MTQARPVHTCHPSWTQRWVQGGAWDLSPRQPVLGRWHDPLGCQAGESVPLLQATPGGGSCLGGTATRRHGS